MKFIGTIFVLMGVFASTTLAETTTAQATVKVQVKSIFKLSLDRSDINFRELAPGESRDNIPETGIRVTSFSNTGRPWYLKVNSVSDLRDGDRIIPSKGFQWYGWSEGKGKWAGTGTDTIKQTPALAYIADSAEYNCLPDGVDNYFKFRLSVPANQPAGFYQSIVQFTLTE